MATERTVAGLRCGEVLADLSDYLDGALPAARREQIEAHLRGCNYCERFGQQFAASLRVLREQLGPADPIDDAVAVRLRDRLRQERA